MNSWKIWENHCCHNRIEIRRMWLGYWKKICLHQFWKALHCQTYKRLKSKMLVTVLCAENSSFKEALETPAVHYIEKESEFHMDAGGYLLRTTKPDSAKAWVRCALVNRDFYNSTRSGWFLGMVEVGGSWCCCQLFENVGLADGPEEPLFCAWVTIK